MNNKDIPQMKPMINNSKTINSATTIVFIDAGVENADLLIEGVIPTTEVFVLDGTADGIEQISQVLQQRQNIDVVHIISHGSPGCLYLGNSQLSLDTLIHYAPQLQQWDVANLLLYGCNVAAGDAGEEFITKLHALTEAEIAASKTLTGSAAKGGNWELEVTTAKAFTTLAFHPSVIAAYEGILTQTNDWTQPSQHVFSFSGSQTWPQLNLTFSDGTASSITTNDAGWVAANSNGTFDYSNDNPNIYAGFTEQEYRNYFLFNISSLTGKTVTSATANFPSSEVTGTPDASESFELFDFNESFYQNGGLVGPVKPIHDDLITGMKYSASPYVFQESSDYQPFSLTLSAAAITDLNQAISSGNILFGMGGAVTTLSGLSSNNAPTELNLSPSSINENVAANSSVGTFNSTDPDTDNTFTYSLVAGTGDTNNSAFSIVSNQLQINASPDFEAQSTYNIRVRTTDQGGLTYDEPLVVNINNVNETPTDLTLSNNSIAENVAANSTVGTFTSTDPDTGNTFTYSLVAGTGDTNNSAFSIVSNQLRINASPDFETKSSYSIRVRTTDTEGLTYDKPLVVNINDIDEFFNLTPNNDLFQGNGTASADQINGLPGSDRLYGNAGNDTIDGGDGDDVVYGGNDNDLLRGGNGSDRLYGDAGNDELLGEVGNDILYGGDGNDLLNGGAGSDQLYGNAGSDTFVLASGMGLDSIYNFQDGADRIRLDGGLTFGALQIAQSGTSTLIKIASTGVTLASLVNTNSALIGVDDFIAIAPVELS
ncbi:DUF4347 domain-containing protein [Microcoleus sp. herbarium5]|uniref:DUF4347 domain-containing protein n=1 Tax=Microcoleus sp. herbarium5 TaxID=3055434 RepID=UPI002FCFEEB9